MITSVDGTVSTYYMHLNSFANIKKGDFVKEGTIIGYIGGSGKGLQNKYSPHLHYEIIVEGKHIDPVIREDILVDPQKINEPIRMGDLQSSYIEANSKPLLILNCILGYSACGLAL